MMPSAFVDLTNQALIDKFSELAKKMGIHVLECDTAKANRIFDQMEKIDRILRDRGSIARFLLLPLLDDRDRFVRYYAAQYLLGLAPERARAVIEWNKKYGFDAIAGDAGMLLRSLDSGKYKPD
jgi:hypothetical protein